MQALQSLTELFKSHITDSKSLDIWVEDGALFCGQGPLVDGYELEYTAIVFVQNARLKPHILFMHLVNWLNNHDPERTEKGLPAPTFATQVLDDGKCDIKIKIDLRESYSLAESEQGNWKQQGTRYECISEFEAAVQADELNELVYFVGHSKDLP
ncbi:phage tail protein [Vibrio coralliilyticus]|uniref:phage tail protein n=1 Tax=Vibrio coralliilyticus TaxID=190893 RepID=UPI0015609F2D|nr:phage tail protein [Vibrio coralliilyticus]NRF28932.1 phage tail protein [Vibrio coralliilyticus]NRF50817.1 phage tail protein [Vibrio coralliilyticus]NRG05691.1 phage tail protein [Vibrio coralliilyticus]